MSREAMKLALEALEEINKLSIGENAICLPAEIDGAMDALRERLAQPEQELVMKRIKTWSERCEEHPDHQQGMISEGMIRARMQEEIDELRQALETEQEPVAWLSEGGDVSRSKRYMDEMGFKCNPLYTAPPKREWVGLTDEEVNGLVSRFKQYKYVLLREVEAKLKEKNT